MPGWSVQGALGSQTQTLSHTHKHTLTNARSRVCITSDTGGTVLHNRCGLVFMFVGAVLQRAGAL